MDFLNRNGQLFRDGEAVINDVGLAALALLVAESDPKDKEIIIHLIMNMLAGVNELTAPAWQAKAAGERLQWPLA